MQAVRGLGLTHSVWGARCKGLGFLLTGEIILKKVVFSTCFLKWWCSPFYYLALPRSSAFINSFHRFVSLDWSYSGRFFFFPLQHDNVIFLKYPMKVPGLLQPRLGDTCWFQSTLGQSGRVGKPMFLTCIEDLGSEYPEFHVWWYLPLHSFSQNIREFLIPLRKTLQQDTENNHWNYCKERLKSVEVELCVWRL